MGTCLAVKNKSEKSVAASAALSAFLGITEPAMYGVNLKYKRPFVFAMASSAVAAAFLSFFHAGAMAYAPPGLFTIITYQADHFGYIVLGVMIAVILSAVLSFFFGVPKQINGIEKGNTERQTAEESSVKTSYDITSPIIGELKPLSQVPDEAFSSESMGKGTAVVPREGKVYAPFDGTVEAIFPTKHALGLTSSDGIEMLIHVGLDTVELNGEYFTSHISAGEKINKGQLLLEFDLQKISEKYPIITPIIISNSNEFKSVVSEPAQTVGLESVILHIEK